MKKGATNSTDESSFITFAHSSFCSKILTAEHFHWESFSVLYWFFTYEKMVVSTSANSNNQVEKETACWLAEILEPFLLSSLVSEWQIN